MNPNTYESQTTRAISRKLFLIEKRGGGCEQCGYKKNIAALDFHHLEKSKKKFQLDARHLSNNRMEVLLEEFEKCLLLCANCHREEHYPNLDSIELAKNNWNNLRIKKINKPNCCDCNIEINYGCQRCRCCSNLYKRKSNRPNKCVLQNEINEHGYMWCGRKYGVSNTTVKRWLK
jgi:hypothetical protein